MQKPVVFLDIDGVLNSADDSHHAHISDLFNLICIKGYKPGDWVTYSKLQLLQEFLAEIDARVIMVSSWFWGDPQTPEHIQENLDMIDFLGLTDRVLAVSRHTGGGLGRGEEVLRIVESLGLKDWVVIDDAGSMMYEFDTHQIDGKVGLTREDTEILKERIKNGQH